MAIQVPFFRPQITDKEVDEVVSTLRSGWLTSGPKVRQFEQEFAAAVGAHYAVSINSCTAALHLAAEAMGLKQGQGVLVPTMTFAATAEVIRYSGAVPILVDCDPLTTNMDLEDAERRMARPIVGIVPVHVGGLMMDMQAVNEFASKHGLWVIEDAAHSFPASWRQTPGHPWQRCGQQTSNVTCFSFYANKTITTGEGGMAVMDDIRLEQRIRLMSLHGLSNDAWGRYTNKGHPDYKIVAPGFKYNLTDIAAGIGIHQLDRAEEMRLERETIAHRYREAFADISEIKLPHDDVNRIHSWHLFPIRLQLQRLSICRNSFMEELKKAGVGCSMHWRPLHLHPYYRQSFGLRPEDYPTATAVWKQLISLPIFQGMQDNEVQHVITTVKSLCGRARRSRMSRFMNGSKSKEAFAAERSSVIASNEYSLP
jgi:dTDP-4-amino-4,6-dideoxygalactose transaminase